MWLAVLAMPDCMPSFFSIPSRLTGSCGAAQANQKGVGMCLLEHAWSEAYVF
jgi:hypothetical protein